MKKNRDIKVVFIGGRDRGLECIRNLVEKRERLIHVFCMIEDRHEKEKFSSVIEEYVKLKKIPYTLTKTVKKEIYINLLKKLNPDLIIVVGWRTIIPKEILAIPRLGVVGAHESLLPKYRGFAPINWAVINGEKKTGVTLFYFNESIDSGNIISQEAIAISENDSAGDVYQKAKDLSLKLIFNNLEKIKSGKVKGRKQNEKLATYTCSRIPEDGEISWNWDTRKIFNFIRALSSPYPGAFTSYNGVKLIINKATVVKNPKKYIGLVSGRVVSINNDSVDVLTTDGILKILEVSLNGEKIIKPRELINSIKCTLGR